jgi:hypothetical protein
MSEGLTKRKKLEGLKMKFYIRRAVFGLVSIPFVAGAWCFVYLAMIMLGGEPSQSLTETYNNGLLIASTLAVAFTFAPQFSKLLDKISGE